MAKKFEILNSTAEFLIFQIEGKESGVQVIYHDQSVWCTQKAMTQLFDCASDNIGLHLKNIYETGELRQEATTEKFSVVHSFATLLAANGVDILTISKMLTHKSVKNTQITSRNKFKQLHYQTTNKHQK